MSERAGMPKVGDVVAAKYRIDAIVGEGGMGTVFAATHQLTGKRVAVKWMLPELARDHDAVQRFLREAQAAGRIDHRNVVDVYDVGEHGGSPFLVMEYLHGETLTDTLARGGHSARDIIEILVPAMRGVAAAHRTGVVHRDLKPDNIFLARDADGQDLGPKVLDFGISKFSTEGQIDPKLTKTGAVVGTPYYMSPEQIRGSSSVDRRSDVYSFGVILYESLTGRVPFDGENYSGLILEIATGTAVRPRELNPELPIELEAIVIKAMAREADQRYPDLESLIAALEPFIDKAAFQVRASDPAAKRRLSAAQVTSTPFTTERPTEPPRARWPGYAAGAVAVLALGTLAGWLFVGGDGPNRPAHVVEPAPVQAALPPPEAPVAPPAAEPPAEPTPLAPPAGGPAAGAADAGAAEQAAEAAPPPAAPAPAPSPAEPERKERLRPTRPARRTEATAAPAPTEAPAPRPAAKGTGRTGALGVDDF